MSLPASLGPSPSKYMQGLKTRLEHAAETAALVSAKRHNAYATQFKRRALEKTIEVGNRVLLFDDQRPGKLFPQWKGQEA